MGNPAKGMSYAEAWRRIKAAREGGHHFEAVTICESILSDRLLSYVAGVKPATKLHTHSPFSKLIAEWRALAGQQLVDGAADLGKEVDAWRVARNVIVHGLVKAAPGAATEPVDSFLERAAEAAREGERLARKVSDWHRKQLAQAKQYAALPSPPAPKVSKGRR